MGWVVWLLQPLKVKHFLEMIKNAENGHFLQAVKSHYFGNFYSKLCCSNRNQVNDMKPKPHKTYFPKFSENINGLFVTPVVIEIFQFESRTSVVVNFCRSEGDDSPVSFVLYGWFIHFPLSSNKKRGVYCLLNVSREKKLTACCVFV